MKNQTLLLLLLSLATTNIIISSQDSDTGNTLITALGSPNYKKAQNCTSIEQKSTDTSTKNSQMDDAQPSRNSQYNLSTTHNKANTTQINHQTAQDIPSTPYSLASATQQSQLSQASTVSTEIDHAHVSSQESNSSHRIYRVEEMEKQVQEHSYSGTVSDSEDN
jgi:hypothetical protein